MVENMAGSIRAADHAIFHALMANARHCRWHRPFGKRSRRASFGVLLLLAARIRLHIHCLNDKTLRIAAKQLDSLVQTHIRSLRSARSREAAPTTRASKVSPPDLITLLARETLLKTGSDNNPVRSGVKQWHEFRRLD